MAEYRPFISGNWSNLSNWLTGTFPGQPAGSLPGPSDEVYANSWNVTIDVDAQASFITTTSGQNSLNNGTFFISNGVTLSANVRAGNTTCLVFLSSAPNTCTVIGDISGSRTLIFGSNANGLLNSSSGTINVSGNIIGGVITGNRAVINNSSGSINIKGDVFGGDGTDCQGIRNNSSGSISVTGNVAGGRGTSSQSDTNGAVGILNASGGLVTIYGDVSGGGPGQGAYGIMNSGPGGINIFGNVYGPRIFGNAIGGVYMSSGSFGRIDVVGDVYPSPGIGGANIWNNSDLGGTVNLSGSVYGSVPFGSLEPIRKSGIGAITNIRGNIFGSNIVNYIPSVRNSGSRSVLTVFGNLSAGSSSSAVNSGSLFTITRIYGDVYGGSLNNSRGITNESSGTVEITGNCFGGTSTSGQAVLNSSIGIVRINGRGIGGLGAQAIANTSDGACFLKTSVGNNFGLGSTFETAANPGLTNSSIFGACYVEELSCGQRGVFPISGPNIYIIRKPNNQATYVGATSAFIASPISNSFIISPSSIFLYNSLSGDRIDTLVPLVSNVLFNTVYDLGSQNGTLILPSEQTVVSGVQFGSLGNIKTGRFFTDLPRAWQTQLTAITATDSFGVKFKNIITLSTSNSAWIIKD